MPNLVNRPQKIQNIHAILMTFSTVNDGYGLILIRILFVSLRRGPGANVQDSNGYSALHYASLNGHTDCVKVLLMHEASANLPDNRGSSPLHLAAWAGHQEIVKLLLTQSNRPANPNLQVIIHRSYCYRISDDFHDDVIVVFLCHRLSIMKLRCIALHSMVIQGH